jgi:hypothetical protein
MMVAMPTPAGFDHAAGEQYAADQQRKDGSQLVSHGYSRSTLIVAMFFWLLLCANLAGTLLTPRPAVVEIDPLDHGLVGWGRAGTWSNCQGAKDGQAENDVTHVVTSVNEDGRWVRQLLGLDVLRLRPFAGLFGRNPLDEATRSPMQDGPPDFGETIGPGNCL